MGTAGLDVKRLSGLLERQKVDCVLIQDNRWGDHCVLRISSVKRPNVIALVEYENQGEEPRLVGMTFIDKQKETLFEDGVFEWEHQLDLSGSIQSDPDKIAVWVLTKFLKGN
jgi:hypothetical protein